MKKSGNKVSIILVTVAVLFSLYTLTMPWVQVHPVLSELMGYAEGPNDAAADGISAVVRTVTSLFDPEDHWGDDGSQGISEAGNRILQALSDEKEIVGILSGGECTPYDCSRIFQIAGTYTEDETIRFFFLACGYLFYVVCVLGVLAIVLAFNDRYFCALLYAGSLGLHQYLLSDTVEKINDTLKVSAFSLMDSTKAAAAGAGAVAFLAIVGMAGAGGKEKEKEKEKESRPREYSASKGFRTRTGTRAGSGPDLADLAGRVAGKVKKHKTAAAAVLSAFVLFLAAIGIYSLVKQASPVTIDLSAYASLHITGYDGYGKASCEFSEEDFMQKIEEQLLNKKRGEEELTEEDTEEIARTVCEKTQIEISDEGGLFNGDEVSLDVTMDPEASEILDRYHVKAEFLDAHIVQEVKDLQEVRSYDPFEEISVAFQGAEPYGEAVVTYSGEYGDALEIETEPGYNLRNGEEIEITVLPVYGEEELIGQYGVRLSGKSKTFTVEGLKYYPERIEEIPSGELARIAENAQWIAKENISGEYDSDEQMMGVNCCGQYFASAVDEDAQLHNQLYCVYEVEYANTSGKAFSYYYYVRLDNIMIDPKTEEASVDYDRITVPQKPSLTADTLNLSEFVIASLFPPRILSGYTSEDSFYENYIRPLESTCIVSNSF